MDIKTLKVLKVKCETDILFFTRYLYKEIHNRKFQVAHHHIEISKFLTRVINGEIKRGIINIAPRYGKTEQAVKMFIAHGLAINPQSKFIHLSYSDDLALDNSSQTKEYIQHEAFQRLWPMQLKKDAQGKKKWFNEDGGGVYATASGGAITGFGAGVAESEIFSGAIIIDDPLKPDDAFSDVKRKAVNDRYNNTIRSRVNSRDTPIVIIMQRLHEEDLSGFLLDGGSGEEWEHLKLPALDEFNYPLWEEKQSFEELEMIRQADRYTFAGQYMQEPSPDEGGEWRKEWFNIVPKQSLNPDIVWKMVIDGAYTKDTKNDPTGIQIQGSWNGQLYILSSIDKYLEIPELIRYIESYVSASGVHISMIYIEPKASGKSISQILLQETSLNVTEIRSKFVSISKIERARLSSPYIESGRVNLVEGNWNDAYLDQVGMFPNAKHDEHVDLTAYGIERELIEHVDLTVTVYN
jgi:predicted phage terminase large subunit-like protein